MWETFCTILQITSNVCTKHLRCLYCSNELIGEPVLLTYIINFLRSNEYICLLKGRTKQTLHLSKLKVSIPSVFIVLLYSPVFSNKRNVNNIMVTLFLSYYIS